MQKSILVLIAVLTTLSLAAYGIMNRTNNDTDLDIVYKVDSRYMATITKEDLLNATSVLDIVPEKATRWWEVEFQKVAVTVIDEDGNETRFTGDSKILNATQIMLLQSADYSINFYINASSKDKHPETGDRIDYAYYFTIIPEKEAEYTAGHEALINYLKAGTKEKIAIIKQDQLKPGQVKFTVTKNGTVEKVKLQSSSGYVSIDESLVNLISNLPEKWKPATNQAGEAVEQELVFFFGLEGC